jgi:hypothetical protein
MNVEDSETGANDSGVPLTPAERAALDDPKVQQAHQRHREGKEDAAPVQWLP